MLASASTPGLPGNVMALHGDATENLPMEVIKGQEEGDTPQLQTEWHGMSNRLDELAHMGDYREALKLQREMASFKNSFDVSESIGLRTKMDKCRATEKALLDENKQKLLKEFDEAWKGKIKDLREFYGRLFEELESRQKAEVAELEGYYKAITQGEMPPVPPLGSHEIDASKKFGFKWSPQTLDLLNTERVLARQRRFSEALSTKKKVEASMRSDWVKHVSQMNWELQNRKKLLFKRHRAEALALQRRFLRDIKWADQVRQNQEGRLEARIRVLGEKLQRHWKKVTVLPSPFEIHNVLGASRK
mmetsp:Transcript_23693/g.46550  ORF Transcript_23693/g.46550 Transcript_23693/m.46550 type:complete len:304 (-) Transcript_23693:438-1349(-)